MDTEIKQWNFICSTILFSEQTLLTQFQQKINSISAFPEIILVNLATFKQSIFFIGSPKIINTFNNNSKNKNRNIDFSFISAHSASFLKIWPLLRGGGLHILTWKKSNL